MVILYRNLSVQNTRENYVVSVKLFANYDTVSRWLARHQCTSNYPFLRGVFLEYFNELADLISEFPSLVERLVFKDIIQSAKLLSIKID